MAMVTQILTGGHPEIQVVVEYDDSLPARLFAGKRRVHLPTKDWDTKVVEVPGNATISGFNTATGGYLSEDVLT